MKLSVYLKDRGAQKVLADRLKVPASLVSNWAKGKRPVPFERCLPIELATEGKVTRRDLRKDWRKFWPELEQASEAEQRSVSHMDPVS